MKRKFVYFIENEKGEWYRFDKNATFKMHVNSSDRRFRCDCDDCTGNGFDFYPWTIDPLEAAAFPCEAIEQLKEAFLKRAGFENCKITEHEFVD